MRRRNGVVACGSDQSPVHEEGCLYFGQYAVLRQGLCRECIRDGFDNVYRITGRDKGWRWELKWKSRKHPKAVGSV